MSGVRRPRLVLPPPDHEPSWRALLNRGYVVGDDAMFRWLQSVRDYVEEQEKKRRRAA